MRFRLFYLKRGENRSYFGFVACAIILFSIFNLNIVSAVNGSEVFQEGNDALIDEFYVYSSKELDDNRIGTCVNAHIAAVGQGDMTLDLIG